MQIKTDIRANDSLKKYRNSSTSRKAKFLLYGVTGSGKTQIYIEMALKARALGKQILILVPEIVLTGQLVTSFKEYFADDVAVIHSRLSIGGKK